ncbi:hypothetical protein pb186bvf_009169 [Paramecium bursaria]
MIIKKWFKNWRMRNQVCVLNFMITFIVFTLFIVFYVIQLVQVVQQLQLDSEQMLSKQSYQEMNPIISIFETQLHEVLNTTFRRLSNMNALYKYSESHEFQFQQQIPLCVEYNPDEIYPSYYHYDFFCVSIYGEYPQTYPQESKYKSNNTFVQLLNEFNFELDMTSMLLPNNFYFASIDQSHYSAWWPQWWWATDYIIDQRPWYKKHLEQCSKIPVGCRTFSDLYLFYNPVYVVQGFTQTYSLTNQENQLLGILASDVQITDMFMKYPSLNIAIVNYDGQLILLNYQLHAVLQQTEQYYIYNKSQTGWDYSDWVQIINYAQGAKTQSDCKSSFNNDELFCRHNDVYQQDIIIVSKNLSNPNFVIVLFNNLSFETRQKEMSQSLNKELYQTFITYCFIWILASSGIILIQMILLYYIFKPLVLLIEHSKNFLKANNSFLILEEKIKYVQLLQLQKASGSYYHYQQGIKLLACKPPINNFILDSTMPVSQNLNNANIQKDFQFQEFERFDTLIEASQEDMLNLFQQIKYDFYKSQSH